ncbi:MAG: carbohydrate ABC transporter permease, partial [Halanaerobium sp.]
MKRKHKESLTSLAILSPSIITLAVFVYGFIARSVQISLLDWDTFGNFMRKAKDYVGLENYIDLFSTSRFQTDLWNTLYFTLFFILGCLVIGILLSLILNNEP